MTDRWPRGQLDSDWLSPVGCARNKCPIGCAALGVLGPGDKMEDISISIESDQYVN